MASKNYAVKQVINGVEVWFQDADRVPTVLMGTRTTTVDSSTGAVSVSASVTSSFTWADVAALVSNGGDVKLKLTEGSNVYFAKAVAVDPTASTGAIEFRCGDDIYTLNADKTITWSNSTEAIVQALQGL